MEFHPQKCQVLTISKKKHPIKYDYKLNNHLLEHVDSAKYLGCTISSELNWRQHINSISAKANKTISFLRRNLNISSTAIKQQAYFSLVRPSVEYASVVWDPHEKGDIQCLEKVQRRAARFVKNRYHNRSSVTDMLEDLKRKSLEQRRKETRLALMFKITNDSICINKSNCLIPSTRTSRHSPPHAFQILPSRTECHKQSFFPRTIRDWNLLDTSVVSVGTVEAFKTQLATFFL